VPLIPNVLFSNKCKKKDKLANAKQAVAVKVMAVTLFTGI